MNYTKKYVQGSKRKQRYVVFYGEEKIISIEGTKRTIINRLKRISTPTWCESLFVELPNGDVQPYEDQNHLSFTDNEMDEAKNL